MNITSSAKRYVRYLMNFGPRVTFYYLLYPRFGGAKAIAKRHYEIKRYIKKEFKEVFDTYRNTPMEKAKANGQEPPVWVCWLQGEEKMPEIVRICYKSLLKHSADKKVNLVTSDNLNEYIQIPDFIREYLDEGKISRTHFADYIRIMLLAKYGGLWIDASVLITGDITDETQRPFYTIKQRVKHSIHYVSDYRWTVSLIGCSESSGKYMFSCLKTLFDCYLRKRTFFIDFFLFDYLIAAMYEELPAIKELIDNNRENCESFYLLSENLNKKYEEKVMQDIREQGKFHKTSWKQELHETTADNEQTFYGYIKNL